VFQTKVHAARLVYSDVRARFDKRAGESPEWIKGTQVIHQMFGMNYFSEELRDGLGDIEESSHALIDLAGLRVDVTNHSDEPIGGAYLRIINPVTGEIVHVEEHMLIGTLDPKTTQVCIVYVPKEWDSEIWDRPTPDLLFTDSAGQPWRRNGTSPPTEEVIEGC